MPIYEFRCSTCNTVYEFLLKLEEQPPDQQCSTGGGLCRLEKRMSGGSFKFKGQGWGPRGELPEPVTADMFNMPTITRKGSDGKESKIVGTTIGEPRLVGTIK
jgi:putative FmdB family regulatory protein